MHALQRQKEKNIFKKKKLSRKQARREGATTTTISTISRISDQHIDRAVAKSEKRERRYCRYFVNGRCEKKQEAFR